MKIDPNISVDEFREEMQHRVVRYPLRSLAVRRALCFARKHSNPEYYRIASNKVHTQRQFLRELNGPGLFEKLFDYFSLGSLREIVVTLMLVGLAVLGIDAGRKFLNTNDRKSSFEQMDVDQLAKRLGILLEDSATVVRPVHRQMTSTSSPVVQSATQLDPSKRDALSEDDVQKIVAAVLVAMRDQPKSVPAVAAPNPVVPVTSPETSQVAAETPTTSPAALPEATSTNNDSVAALVPAVAVNPTTPN